MLYLGGLVRKKDASGTPIGEASMIFASPFFLDLDAWPIFAKNTAISASRVARAVGFQAIRRPSPTKGLASNRSFREDLACQSV
jgi:hypothetical protein